MSNEYGKPPPVNATTYRETVARLAQECDPKTIVEIGVWAGGLSKKIQEYCPNARFIIIDPWEPYGWKDGSHYHDKKEMEGIAQEVISWAKDYGNIEIMRARWADVLDDFEDNSIDFIHIDDDKEPGIVEREIQEWWNKVTVGGILSGDNFEDERVSVPVNKIFPNRELIAKGRVWVVRKK